MIQCTIQFRQ